MEGAPFTNEEEAANHLLGPAEGKRNNGVRPYVWKGQMCQRKDKFSLKIEIHTKNLTSASASINGMGTSPCWSHSVCQVGAMKQEVAGKIA